MKLFIPREHGAWAMLIVPYLLGTLFSSPNWSHAVFFVGMLGFYFATGPILSYIRQPMLGKSVLPALTLYTLIGFIFILPVVLNNPSVIALLMGIVPFFIVNLFFARAKKERLFINDLFAIVGFSMFVLIAFYIGNGFISMKAVMILLINICFFVASVFHVKTFIREKGNPRFKWVSDIYHGLLVFIPAIIGLPFLALAFAISAVKTWVMPREKKIKPMTLGLIEMGNSIGFILLVVLFI